MPRRPPAKLLLSTAARWPVGVSLTSWRYFWRTLPVHRRELVGSLPRDAGPDLPEGIELEGIQRPSDGAGPLVHRIYRAEIAGAQVSPEQLLDTITRDLNAVAPSEFASFHKLSGDAGAMAVGDEYVVRMPGPWNGPVRVIDRTPRSFRLVTLDGHLEAGQIEFRAILGPRTLDFVIESWARSGDRLSDFLYSHLRMAKEVQLHMWTSVLQRVVALAGGAMEGGVVITTRPVAVEEGSKGARDRLTQDRAQRRLAGLATLAQNFDPSAEEHTRANGWHVDDMIEPLAPEPSGPPLADGSWETAAELMRAYQLADPRVVRATFREDAPLAGRDMLLEIRFHGLRLHLGVRVDEVYDEERQLAGRSARVFGWSYTTLEGHFEEGRMYYEIWKWLDTGDVEFRLRAYSRTARRGSVARRVAFRLIGRHQQLAFYRQVCRCVRRLTEAELETKHVAT